jgi:hypothetical protein
VEIAAHVETPACGEDCRVPVGLGSEDADGEGLEGWVDNDRVETVRRVRGEMQPSASPLRT